MENKKVTIKDIAKIVGVSVATVSRIINNKDQDGIKISPETRDKVLKVVDELHYRPNLLAKSLIMNRSFIIGVIVPDLIGTFFPEVVQGIEEVIQSKGYTLILSNTLEDHKREKREIEMMRDRMVDGLIVVPSSVTDIDYYRQLKKEGLKFIFLDRHINDSAFDYVISDDETGAHEIVTYLLDQNYKQIAFMKGSDDNTASINRLEGYKKALFDKKLHSSSLEEI
jgi:LacI family transcriptional regulator